MSDDVNDYREAVIGDEFTAKDFRTWHGTLAAFEALARTRSRRRLRRKAEAVVAAVDEVADRLGNTRAVARQANIHQRSTGPSRRAGSRSAPSSRVPLAAAAGRPSCCACSRAGPRHLEPERARRPAKMRACNVPSTGSTTRSG